MTVNGKPNSVFGNRFLFTGREWLSDLRLYDYRNRMYQPELGRFLQPDPIQFKAEDYNLYRYCHNDPINKNDPTGLGPDEEMLTLPEGSDTIAKAIAAATSAVIQHVSDNRMIYIGAAIAATEARMSRGHGSGMGPMTRFIAGPKGPINVGSTIDRIKDGVKLPHRNDGAVFRNREGLLPRKPDGYYKEYVHPTAGQKGPGAERVVQGQNGESYYTPDHYKTFIPLNPKKDDR